MVIQAIPALNSTRPLDPEVFVFFKGFNAPDKNGLLTAEVPLGLPAGAYRMCSMNASANHQPVLVAIAQHGSLDDCVYVSLWRRGLPPFLLLGKTLTPFLDQFTVNSDDKPSSTNTNSGRRTNTNGGRRTITTASDLLIVWLGLVWVSFSL